jgi:predicted GNAT family acetyltransferase
MRWRKQPTLRRMYGVDKPRIIRFMEQDPVNAVLARANVDHAGLGAMNALGLFDPRSDDMSAFAWDSGNVIPLGFSDSGLDMLAESLLSRTRRCSSLVGPADQVLGLWERVQGAWGPDREVRGRQFSMTVVEPGPVAPDPAVRPARRDELDLVFPASVAMFTEEVGYDPTIYGASYRHRADSLIRNGMTYVKIGPAPGGGERVVFKADVGALAGGVAQIQGVWTAPDMRGRGMATTAMAAVVRQVLATHAPTVSLYVNDFNVAAVQLYTTVGFRVVGEWATVLLP